MGMTIAGIVLAVASGGLVVAATQCTGTWCGLGYGVTAVFMGPTGLLLVIIGGPMWGVGQEDAVSLERVSGPHPSSSQPTLHPSSHPSSQRAVPMRSRDHLSIEAGNLAIRLEERGSARLLVGQGIGVGW